MVNPRRSSYGSNINNHQNPENQLISLISILNLLKKPQAFPLLLTIFIFLTWVSLRFQHSSSSSIPQKWSRELDLKANLVRFSSSYLSKDKRGWLLNPISAALDARISGGAVSCDSVHVGEIRPGGMRGNHRHYTCNETFILWGARLKFRTLCKTSCDNRLNEIIVRASDDKREAELLGKKYEEKYKQVAEIASKLTIKEAKSREYQAGTPGFRKETPALESRMKNRISLKMKAGSPGFKKEGATVWDEEWDKFEDEGKFIWKETRTV